MHPMQRRDFIKVCAAGAAVSANDLFAAQDLKPHFYSRTLLTDEGGRPLGVIELRPSGHRAEIGYVLGRAWWGQGLMTEAARAVVEWGLSRSTIYRVWAVTDVDNRASARVLEKTGMLREGRLRSWLNHPNLGSEPRDCWCYARIRG